MRLGVHPGERRLLVECDAFTAPRRAGGGAAGPRPSARGCPRGVILRVQRLARRVAPERCGPACAALGEPSRCVSPEQQGSKAMPVGWPWLSVHICCYVTQRVQSCSFVT